MHTPSDISEFLESIFKLPLDDQLMISEIIHKNVIEEKRKKSVGLVKESKEEYRPQKTGSKNVVLTKSKKNIQIPLEEWERLKRNPVLTDALELLEDIADFEKAKKVKGKDISIDKYLEKPGISNKS